MYKKQELLRLCKGNLVFNKEVASLLPLKTMTRRVCNVISYNGISYSCRDKNNYMASGSEATALYEASNYFAKHKVNDILWIREPAKVLIYEDYDAHFEITYKFADGTVNSLTMEILINEYGLKDYEFENKYLSKKYMEQLKGIPNGCLKEMARYFVKIIDVRVERLKDISDEDIIREGVDIYDCDCHKLTNTFKNLWNSTAKAPYKWEDNPYVFVYEWEYLEYDNNEEK